MKNYFKAFTVQKSPDGHSIVDAQFFAPFDDANPADIAGAYGQALTWYATRPGARVSVARRIPISGAWDDVRIIGRVLHTASNLETEPKLDPAICVPGVTDEG